MLVLNREIRMKEILLLVLIPLTLGAANNLPADLKIGFGFASDFVYSVPSRFEWNYYRPIDESMYIKTDTVFSIQRGRIHPTLGLSFLLSKPVYRNYSFDFGYVFTTMKYDYDYTNGIHKTNSSNMNWKRHSVDIGMSRSIHSNEDIEVIIGLGLNLTFHTPILGPAYIEGTTGGPSDSYRKTSLRMNDVRGEYLYFRYIKVIPNTRHKYHMTLQVISSETLLLGWISPSIQFGLVY